MGRSVASAIALSLLVAACTRSAGSPSTTEALVTTSPPTTVGAPPTTQASTPPDPVTPEAESEPELDLDPCDEHLVESAPTALRALATRKVMVEFLGDDRVTGYALSVHGDGWTPVARAEPLARLSYLSPAEGLVVLDLDEAELEIGSGRAALRGSVSDPDGPNWEIGIDFSLGSSECVLDVTSTVTVDQDRDIAFFGSPVLDVGAGGFAAAKDTAVLGGLDWTVDGEESQAVAATPDPLDVAWPMMAVSHEGHLVGLMWDPTQAWDESHIMPQPVFASPNWIEAKTSHLLTLGVPNASHWLEESTLVDERVASFKSAAATPIPERVRRPYPLARGSVLTVGASIVADYPAEIPEAVQLYVNRFGLPPQPAFSLDDGLEAVIDSYLTTAWNPDTGAWYQGTFGPDAPYITVASQLAAYADDAESTRAETVRGRITEAMGPVWQSRHDPGPSSAHMDFLDYGFRTGDVEEVLAWSAGSSTYSRGLQKDDGSWVYLDSDNICDAALGEVGTDLLGTNATHASLILEYARITREQASVDAGLRALEHMDRFLKPAGAQAGEVPLVHGDLWAVAWAVRAYVDGHRITGDERHLHKAREWAFKGIPFLYTWSHPERSVMAYSTVGVMGTSCWTYSWAGQAVQWVGLDYAAALLELATVDDSFPWTEIAGGIARAAVGMFDTRPEPAPREWHEVVLTTTAPANAVGMQLGVRVNHELSLPGPTEFWLDDVALIDAETGANLIANGDFESRGLNDYPWFWDGDSVELVSGSECRAGRCVHAVVAVDDILSAGADVTRRVIPGRVYDLRLWVRLSDDPPPSSGPLFRVEYPLEFDGLRWVNIFARPLAGLLPDLYDIEDQAGYAPILPERLGDVLLGLADAALHVDTHVVTDGEREFVISTLSDVTATAVGDGGELRFRVRPRTGPTSYIAIATDRSPTSVLVNGDGLGADQWRWAADTRLLFATIAHPDGASVDVLVR